MRACSSVFYPAGGVGCSWCSHLRQAVSITQQPTHQHLLPIPPSYLNIRWLAWKPCRVHRLAVVTPMTQTRLDRSSGGPATNGQEIAFLCEQGQVEKALDALIHLEERGIAPATGMFRTILKSCIARKALAQAKRVHAHLARRGLELTGTLGECMVNTLVKCGGLQDALEVFYGLPYRTVVSWTIIISAHCKAGRGQLALEMYQQMREEGIQPDKYTFISLFGACSTTFDLAKGLRGESSEALRTDAATRGDL